jgi:hypothetical protein
MSLFLAPLLAAVPPLREAARGDIYFTQSVVRARVSEAPVDLLGRERRATA